MSYDVIVAGASFAGLAVATRIKGKTLLIDRKDIGTFPTSACATFYDLLKKMGCEDALLKVFDKFKWQTSYGSYVCKAYQPFCTFDYMTFCRSLFSRFDGEFIKAHVKGYENGAVVTDKGTFSAPVIVDCTGWRAKLASSIEHGFVDEEKLLFGVETVVPYEDDKLSFIMDPRIVERGYVWIFPISRGSRIGLGSLAEDRHILIDRLKGFVASLDMKPGKANGGFIPLGLRRPVVDKIFLVGDSAGEVFPLTFEGIRQSIYFGQECASIIQQVINREISLQGGLNAYREFVERHAWIFNNFLRTQGWVFNAGPKRLELISRLACWSLPMRFVQEKYHGSLELREE